MLDQNIIDQLKTVFEKLENKVTLVYARSPHEDQLKLLEMLKAVATTSSFIELKESAKTSPIPHFYLEYKDKKTGISFTGIPSGHEFTSLILAILNTDQKGKLPDEKILERIKNLKGPIELKTYISLTCENCPDVVQALNIMSLNHKEFTHEMVDGAYVQDEIEKLGIQGVPSVVSNGNLIHSGKITLIDLISKLEEKFGAEKKSSTPSHLGEYDVVVIGGGPAGASAAIYTVRKGLKTAVLAERLGGQVQDTKGIENFISVPYTEGPQLVAQLNQHMATYPISIYEHRRVKEIKNAKEKIKEIVMEDGETIHAKYIVVTTGAKWRELNIPGEKEYLGKGVAFCPHCDGPYYKGKKIAVIGGGNSGVEAAIDLAGIVKEVTVFEFQDNLKADKVLVDKLNSLSNTSIITNAQTKVIHGDGQKVNALEYINRTNNKEEKMELDGVFVQIGLLPNSQFLKGTLELSKFGEIIIDEKGRTSIPGIYAAGDITTIPYKQIIIAMGEGAKAALALFEDDMKM